MVALLQHAFLQTKLRDIWRKIRSFSKCKSGNSVEEKLYALLHVKGFFSSRLLFRNFLL